MTKKDITVSENIDLTNEEKQEESLPTKKQASERKGSGETDIKNAHASGDGAYGRSDKSIIESGEKESGEDANEPSY